MGELIATAPALCEQVRENGEEAHALRVCFVCTGNTCRSPMAAAVTNAWAREELERTFPASFADALTPRVIAESRGLFASDGEPISKHAKKALELAEIRPVTDADYRKHTAKTLAEDEIENFDWLIAISDRHAMELLLRFPSAAAKIICMPAPIADPWGGDLQRYRGCLAEIMAGVAQLLFEKESK